MKKDIGLINVIVISVTFVFVLLFLVNGVSSVKPSHAYVVGACNDMSSSLLASLESGQEDLTYECFGAVGDGTTNDLDAIKKTHDFANKEYYEKGIYLTVHGTEGATYRIIGGNISDYQNGVAVATDVDWHGAKFIIDDNPSVLIDNDSNEKNDLYLKPVFRIASPMNVEVCSMLDFVKNDDSSSCTVSNTNENNFNWNNILVNSSTKNVKPFVDNVLSIFKNDSKMKKYYETSQVWGVMVYYDYYNYIRDGNNSDDGKQQQEMFLVNSKNGNVLNDIEWDYSDINKIKEVRVWPIPEKKVTVKNGSFTTWTNDKVVKSDGSKYPYSQRGIYIAFTGNVLIKNVDHYLKEDIYANNDSNQNESTGNAYYGFIKMQNASYVELNDVGLTPHTFAKVNGTSYGTYDLVFDYSNNIFLNKVVYSCNKTKADGSIDYTTCYGDKMVNASVWGIIGSNGSKNVFIRNSKLNRIDAHRGIHNLLVEDTTVGNKGFRLIGSGSFYGHNLRVDRSDNIISLREDYGATWNGTMVLDGVDYIVNGNNTNPTIMRSNNNQKNYGYQTYYPAVYLRDVLIDDTTYNVTNTNFALLRFYEGSTSSGTHKYKFVSHIRSANVKLKSNSDNNDHNNKLVMFTPTFVTENNNSNIKLNSYSGDNVVNVGYYNNDSSFTYTSDSTANSILGDSTKNTKFSFTNSSSTNSTIQDAVDRVVSNLQTAENKSIIPTPSDGGISISNIQVTNGSSTTGATNNGDGTFTVGVPDDVTSVGINVQTNGNVLYASYPQNTSFSGDSAHVDITIYGVYATKKTYRLNIVRSSTFTKVTPPTDSSCKANLTYDGSEQVLTVDPSEGYEFSNNKKKNAGTYVISVKLKSGYQWNDETTADKTISCTIGKGTVNFTVSSSSFEIKMNDSANYILRANTAGKFTNESSDSQVVSVTPNSTLDVLANSNSVSTIKGLKVGRATVTVSFTPTDTDNYNTPASKEISVNVLQGSGSGDDSGDNPVNPSDGGTSVPIPNTQLNKSAIIIIIGLTLIIAGGMVIVHVYSEKKK